MYGNILLIGGTSYLGAHIAYEFLRQNKGNIYFLVRNKDSLPARYRLLQVLRFYFGDKFISKIDERIKIIIGDVTENANLGISHDEISDIFKNTSAVINSGNCGTENIINFCKKYGKKLMHISTTSISGNLEKSERIRSNPDDKKTFAETNLYIKQNLTDQSMLSRFKSEFKILDSIYNGLDAQILRIGNLTNRYSDGIYSNTIKYNSFTEKLKSYIEIGAFPRELLDVSLDFTPVDLAADAIITILNHSSDCNVFHIKEPKGLPCLLFTDATKELGIDVVPVSTRLMLDIINGISRDDTRKDLLSAISEDLYDNKFTYTSSIELDSSFTEDYLKNCGFHWKKLDKNYIVKFLDYFRKFGLIDAK